MHHFITGIAGFIGSHLAESLLRDGDRVSGVDDFSLGRPGYLNSFQRNPRFRFFECDISCPDRAVESLRAAAQWGGPPGVIYHLAANSDIASGVADASVDFKRTLQTTFAVLEAAKITGIARIAFASTSAVYGERDDVLTENSGPLLPISNYGANKLASEALLSAAAETFLKQIWIFRFPNVVGPRATHGAILDFMTQLACHPLNLKVLGNGSQTKPYLHVTELIAAMRFIIAQAKDRRNVFNIGPDGPGTRVTFMAEQVVGRVAPAAVISYGESDRGWTGDVPRFRYSTERLARFGWRPELSSDEAVLRAIEELSAGFNNDHISLSAEMRVTPAKVTHLVIIAGGPGTRLALKNQELPKALVPVGEKPVLQHQLELAAAAGIREVTIFAGYLANEIAGFVGDGEKFGLKVRTAVEREPMGTAGALLQSLESLPDHFFVLYGDIMLAVNLQQMARQHLHRRADLTALVKPTDHPHDSDLVEIDGNDWVTSIHTYPHPADQVFHNLANAALYLVRRDALWPWVGVHGKQDFVKHIMSGLVAKEGHVLAYRSGEYIKDMGTPARLQRIEADWQAGSLALDISGRSRPAIFLDRDGTLTSEKGFLRAPAALELLPGVGLALKSLRDAGFRLVVLTNQPVIARGEATEADVDAMHRRLEWELGKEGAYLDGIYLCPHHPDRGFPGERSELKTLCECRKPATGLFEQACRDLPIDSTASWMIGDQTRDIEMAQRAGLRSILVQTGMAGLDRRFSSTPDHIVPDFAAAVTIILKHQGAPAS